MALMAPRYIINFIKLFRPDEDFVQSFINSLGIIGLFLPSFLLYKCSIHFKKFNV